MKDKRLWPPIMVYRAKDALSYNNSYDNNNNDICAITPLMHTLG